MTQPDAMPVVRWLLGMKDEERGAEAVWTREPVVDDIAYVAEMCNTPPSSFVVTPLVRATDARSAMEAVEAENRRLREALEAARSDCILRDDPDAELIESIDAALSVGAQRSGEA